MALKTHKKMWTKMQLGSEMANQWRMMEQVMWSAFPYKIHHQILLWKLPKHKMDSEYIDLTVVTEFVVLRIRLILKWLLVTVDNWFLSDKIKVVSGQNNLFQYDYRWIFFYIIIFEKDHLKHSTHVLVFPFHKHW